LHLSTVNALRNIIYLLLALVALSACKSKAYLHQGEKRITFADREWQVKSGDFKRGPGNNYFGTSSKNLYVDHRGFLHLKLAPEKDRIYCVEVNTVDTLGYGRYTYSIKGNFQHFDPKVVLGLFTWDHSSFDTQANSEIDIEFSQWGFPLAESILHYSVHPVALERLHLERTFSSALSPSTLSGITTHIMEWRDTSISFYAYKGEEVREEALIERFHYSFRNPARVKSAEGKRSDPIRVPKPGGGVQAHINLWLLGPQKELEQEAPEIIIRDFSYEAF